MTFVTFLGPQTLQDIFILTGWALLLVQNRFWPGQNILSLVQRILNLTKINFSLLNFAFWPMFKTFWWSPNNIGPVQNSFGFIKMTRNKKFHFESISTHCVGGSAACLPIRKQSRDVNHARKTLPCCA